MKTRSLLKQTANCPLIPIHGPMDYTETILICGLRVVYMKTVFMLNALFFPQDKIYSVLRFFFWYFSLIQKNKILYIFWPMLLSSAHTLNNLKIDETIDNIFFTVILIWVKNSLEFAFCLTMTLNFSSWQKLMPLYNSSEVFGHLNNIETLFHSPMCLCLLLITFFFINNIYCNICPKSLKGSSRQLTLFTFNILKIQMYVKIEHTHIKKR